VSGLRLPGRVLVPEAMDGAAVTEADLTRALADLDRLTAAGLAHRPVLGWLGRIALGRGRLRVLDVGCGSGDLLRRIAQWAEARGVALALEGVDVNPATVAVARARTPAGAGIAYRAADVFGLEEAEPDLIVSSHFAHHLSDGDLVRFVRWMERAARVGWFVNDLHRHWLPKAALRAVGALTPVHRFVASDGPISVGRSLVRADWERVIAAAGVERERVAICWHMPFRWGVGTRPEAAR
jgi:SAM-dependent methyltransferase